MGWVHDDWDLWQYLETLVFCEGMRSKGNSILRSFLRLHYVFEGKASTYIRMNDITHCVKRSYLHCTRARRWTARVGVKHTEMDGDWYQRRQAFDNAIYYRLLECDHEQIDRHNVVKHLNENSRTDWKERLTILEEHSAYCEKFESILTQFESMENGHLGLIKALECKIKLEKTDSQPDHSASKRAGPKGESLQESGYW